MVVQDALETIFMSLVYVSGVDAHYEHGSGLVLRGSGDNNLLRAADEVLGSALFSW